MYKGVVYLGGIISGASYDEATEWRVRTKHYLQTKLGIKALDPMRGKNALSGESNIKSHGYTSRNCTDKEIVSSDINDVAMSNIILINLLGAKEKSIGCVAEMAIAHWLHKPVILVIEDEGNPNEHAFVRSFATHRVNNLDDAIRRVERLIF